MALGKMPINFHHGCCSHGSPVILCLVGDLSLSLYIYIYTFATGILGKGATPNAY